jgi:ParB family chromosome partitioning protein
MTKSPRSITAAFGALSGTLTSETQPEIRPASPDSSNSRAPVRVGAGVIGATHRTLSDLRAERDELLARLASGGETTLDPELIDPSPFPDRLPDDNDSDFGAFKHTIETEGQKVPIQVRHHPNMPGRYEVVYGHRRLRAAKELGRPVRAFVADLSDVEMILTQGLENSSRQDLTWAERALYAWRLDANAIKSKDICAALATNEAELARFRTVCRSLTPDVVTAIGRAPKIGRPRWMKLASIVSKDPRALDRIHTALTDGKISGASSDQRFHQATAVVSTTETSDGKDWKLVSSSGAAAGTGRFTGATISLTIDRRHASAFASFLQGEIPEILDRFFAQNGEA